MRSWGRTFTINDVQPDSTKGAIVTHTADVVVIGAGNQGLSAAYHLAKMGVKQIVVLEKEFIGAGSSGRSASMLMLQSGSEPRIKLSQYSFQRYLAFESEFWVNRVTTGSGRSAWPQRKWRFTASRNLLTHSSRTGSDRQNCPRPPCAAAWRAPGRRYRRDRSRRKVCPPGRRRVQASRSALARRR